MSEDDSDFGTENDIAIIGMGVHVPGAHTPGQFWKNLRDGVESVQMLSNEELLDSGVPKEQLYDPNYVKAGAFLDGLADFDAEFFGFSPKEAAIMDPQHRHFLECSWEALEHAGHPPSKFDGSIGVFGGCGMGTYMMYNLITNKELLDSVGYFLLRHTGNDKDFLATRVSYCFDLKGPSLNVQTACSTSLVAVHLGCQSLLSAECDMALAGGVTIEVPHRRGYLYRESEILSPDGHCRAFDHRSAGTIFGSGAGVVALRRLEDALADGDTIYAVIKGSAVNNDGSLKVGYLAPSVNGQAAAVAEALAVANVPADTIDYVEGHGTGTPMGDPIEISALTQAYRDTTEAKGFCGIGSVKTNIGHLDTAAGVVGLIKASLSLWHRQIPPSLNWEAPNPTIDFENSPFYVNQELRDWPSRETPRRAGVNSLGVGGTNAHVVLEQAPAASQLSQPPSALGSELASPALLQLSGRTRAAVDGNAKRLAVHLRENPELDLRDVAYNLRVGRNDFDQRRVLACKSMQEAIDLLESADPQRVFTHSAGADSATTVFLLPGGGAQYIGMAEGLYESEPVFRGEVDRCVQIVQEAHGIDLLPFLFPRDPGDASLAEEFERPSRQLPAIFLIEYALAKLWISWGVTPQAFLGHSMGENTAACLSGVISLEDALRLVCLRGLLFEEVPEGGMLSVAAPLDEVLPLLGEDLDLAVENAPELCVVSGPSAALESLSKVLEVREIDATRIRINIAAHSRMLEPILKAFREFLQKIPLRPPKIPFISNRTGTWITPEQATDPEYWVDHLRGTVHFSSGLETLLHEYPGSLFLEVGPGATLTSLARLQPSFGAGQNLVTSLRHRDLDVSDASFFLTALGRIWASGSSLDSERLFGTEPRQRIPLPTYAFQHRSYWIEPGKALAQEADSESTFLQRLENFEDWFYEPVWEPRIAESQTSAEFRSWLVFVDDLGVGESLVEGLRSAGDSVVVVRNGPRNAKLNEESYLVDSDRGAEGYQALAAALAEDGRLPDRILHLWMLTGSEAFRTELNRFAHNLERSFYSLFFLLRAFAERDALEGVQIKTVSNGARQVADEPVPAPEKATHDGPCRVVPHELGNVSCDSIDVDFTEHRSRRRLFRKAASPRQELVEQLMIELSAPNRNARIAYRNGTRYELSYRHSNQTEQPANAAKDALSGIQEGGTYLVTGGLGGIGLSIAEEIAQTPHVKLLLIGRSGLPSREEWDAWLSDENRNAKTRHAILGVQRLEALGATVIIGRVDVTDHEELLEFVTNAKEHHGKVSGVVHAAGVINDSLVALKGIDEVETVFAPKIYGAMVLDMVFQNHPLDFFVLFSSSSTITAPAGQVDYVAANAYLNAFARSRSARTGERVIALNWGVWNEVGMAADATLGAPIDGKPVKYPIFRDRHDTKEGSFFSLPLSANTHWILDDHRLADGRALLPGTSYIELAATAFAELTDTEACEIRDLHFLLPLEVADGAVQRTRLKCTPGEQGFDFEVQSYRQPATGTGGWLSHVEGSVAETALPTAAPIALDAIRERCSIDSQLSVGDALETAQEQHLRFGPRWSVLRELHHGVGEALAKLSLAEPFEADVEEFRFHPGLLDIATGCAMRLIEGYEESTSSLWVPVSYERIRIHAALPKKIYSWIRNCGENRIEDEAASFDVTLMDPTGEVLIEISNFRIQKAPRGDLLASLKRLPPGSLEPDQRRGGKSNLADLTPAERVLHHNVTQGILAEEGMRAFRRVLEGACGHAAEVVVSSLDLHELSKQSAQIVTPSDGEATSFARPELDSEYKEPSTEIEKKLVEFWESLLGIESVGVDDSFFDLGGHSLIAVRLFAKIKSTWGESLPVSALFEAPTIAKLAGRIPSEDSAVDRVQASVAVPQSADWTSLVPIRNEGSGLPFYCVAGKGGNPMNLRHLAAHFPPEHPFYGIQHRGVDGKLPPHESIEAMAADCVEDMRAVQPEGPYLLGGYSGGGLVIFEMAQQLQALGEEVALMALFDTPSPERYQISRAERIQLHWRELRRQGPEYLTKKLKGRVDRLFPSTEAPSEEEHGSDEADPMEIVAQAWARMEARYVARPYSGSAILYRPYIATNDEWDVFLSGDEYNGWRELVLGGIEVVELPGGHGTMCEEPHVRIFAKRLSGAIAAVCANLSESRASRSA